MAIGEPQARMSGGTTNHRSRIGKAGPAAHPWRRLHLRSKRKQAARGREQLAKLPGGWRRVARGKFCPGGEADALLHGGKAEACLGIHYRACQPRIAGGPEV